MRLTEMNEIAELVADRDDALVTRGLDYVVEDDAMPDGYRLVQAGKAGIATPDEFLTAFYGDKDIEHAPVVVRQAVAAYGGDRTRQAITGYPTSDRGWVRGVIAAPLSHIIRRPPPLRDRGVPDISYAGILSLSIETPDSKLVQVTVLSVGRGAVGEVTRILYNGPTLIIGETAVAKALKETESAAGQEV